MMAKVGMGHLVEGKSAPLQMWKALGLGSYGALFAPWRSGWCCLHNEGRQRQRDQRRISILLKKERSVEVWICMNAEFQEELSQERRAFMTLNVSDRIGALWVFLQGFVSVKQNVVEGVAETQEVEWSGSVVRQERKNLGDRASERLHRADLNLVCVFRNQLVH